ncbi:MAG: DUF4129 domain-containing protein [Streptomyces sp.]|uniref:DUF4129 domain-containing protein n=1 Tax=Streptomyces sp. TaxID=1931 RepID=UPI003D6A91EA
MSGGVTTAALRTAAGLRTAAADGEDDGPPVTTPRTPAREAAERELSKPAYHENDPSLLQRLLDWLWDRVGALLSSAAQATPGGWVGLTVLACAAVLLVIALRLRLGKLRPEPTSEGGTLFDERHRSAAGHRAAAETHASAHRWSEALQERMRAIVRSLEERALLDRRPGRTADEAAAEAARTLPDHAEALRAAAHAFDEVTYAKRPADTAAYSAMRDLDDTLQHARPLLPETGAPGDGDSDTPENDAARRTTTVPDGGRR